ncbi:MAG: hypothetical protein Q4C85_08655 [Actinomyces sp.]|uniref:hypothetical protein n=1 Tax=Actinomyces sp. TaxID=29317 RepID=UPI0026DDB41E|nr:hypothetical protein [Actinomyces sp.]MDO4243808.1 hypothetical protein [Actinomyces sp.]
MGLIASVPAGQARLVQVVVEAGTVPAGERFTVSGEAGSSRWTVRAGVRVSDGGQVVLGDSLAPVNVPVTYRVTWGPGASSSAVSAPVVRRWSGRSLLTDVTGGSVVDLLWQGADARAVDRRVTVHEVPGRPTPVVVMAPAMGAGTLSLTARTEGEHTRAMAAVAARPQVNILFHNPAKCFQCARSLCDVPLVTVLVLTDMSHSRADRLDAAERVWTLKAAVVGVPEPDRVVPTSTWDQLDAAERTWDQVDDMGMSWDEFDRVLWQEVGG